MQINVAQHLAIYIQNIFFFWDKVGKAFEFLPSLTAVGGSIGEISSLPMW